jgi:hypothetical protein
MHRVPQTFCLALSFVVARRADAVPTTRECVASHTEGQILRHGGHLLEAAAQFDLCAVESCPAIVRSDCTEFRHEVETAQPTPASPSTKPRPFPYLPDYSPSIREST